MRQWDRALTVEYDKLSPLFLQHQFFMERARAATLRSARIEAIKKAGTTRRMIAKDQTLRNWVFRRAA